MEQTKRIDVLLNDSDKALMSDIEVKFWQRMKSISTNKGDSE